jgi:hypothetical protein
MKKITKILLIAVGFSMLTIALGSLTSRPVPAQAPPPTLPVTVKNTAANPVPTSAQGTTTVAGTVAITNTPTVNAHITNPVSLASGSLSNTTSTPVFVQEVGAAGRYPFILEHRNVGPDPNIETNNGAYVSIPYTTPSGGMAQTAVIEFVSTICEVKQGITLDPLILNISQPDRSVYTFRLTAQGMDVSSSWLFGGEVFLSQQTKIYASPGSTVTLGLSSNNNGCDLSVSGYLLPQ